MQACFNLSPKKRPPLPRLGLLHPLPPAPSPGIRENSVGNTMWSAHRSHTRAARRLPTGVMVLDEHGRGRTWLRRQHPIYDVAALPTVLHNLLYLPGGREIRGGSGGLAYRPRACDAHTHLMASPVPAAALCPRPKILLVIDPLSPRNMTHAHACRNTPTPCCRRVASPASAES